MLNRKSLYGYLLVEPKTTLKDVVGYIGEKVECMHDRDSVSHIALYRIGAEKRGPEMIIFDS